MALDEFGNEIPVDDTTTGVVDDTSSTIGADGVGDVTVPSVTADDALATTVAAYDTAAEGILTAPNNAYDVNYTAPTVPEDIKPEAGSSYVTPESTVAGQLTRLLDKDSDYIKQAEAKARIGAQKLGLASSSMAEGAARGAAIERGLPIAQQDAKTYSQHNLQQQQAEVNQNQSAIEGLVSGALNEQKYELIDRSQSLQNAFDVAVKRADAETGIALQELQGQWDFAVTDSIKRLEYYLQKDLNDHTVDDTKAQEVRVMSGDLIKNNQIAIENLLKDPDMLQLGPEVYGQLVNNMTAMTTKSIQLIYNSAGLDMDGAIETLLATYEGNVTWGADDPETGLELPADTTEDTTDTTEETT